MTAANFVMWLKLWRYLGGQPRQTTDAKHTHSLQWQKVRVRVLRRGMHTERTVEALEFRWSKSVCHVLALTSIALHDTAGGTR